MKIYSNLTALKIGLLFFACSFSIISQANTSDNADSVKNKGRQLTINLLSPVIYFTPRFQVGYQKRINDRWQWGVEVGYAHISILPNYEKPLNPYRGSKYSSWSIEPEILYSYNKRKKDARYFSLEFFYINHKEHFDNTIRDYRKERRLDANTHRYDLEYDKADYRRKKYGLNLKYGHKFEISKSVGFDLSSGFGFRYRDVKYANIVNPTYIDENLYDDEGSHIVPQIYTRHYITDEGKIVFFNFMIDLKFYVMLK